MAIADWLPRSVSDAALTKDLAAEETLFRVDDKVFAIFDVVAGRIQLIRHGQTGRRLILFAAGPGESIAEPALFSTRYHCDAIAAVASTVRVYPKERALAALSSDPAVAKRYMSILAHQVQGLRARLQIRDIRSARDRVLQFLAVAAGPTGNRVTLSGTLKDLASEIGLTPEALYRTVAALEVDAEIKRSGNVITLIRHDRT